MKIKNNVVTLNGLNYGKTQNTRRQKAAEKFAADTSAAILWQAAQLAAGFDNTAAINRELRDNKEKSLILDYLKTNEVVTKLASFEAGQLKLKQKRDHIEQTSILAGFTCTFAEFYAEATAEKTAKAEAAKERRAEEKAARHDLQQASAIVDRLKTERATALDNGARALELDKRLAEAKEAEAEAKEAFKSKVDPAKQSQLVFLLNQALLAGLDTQPTEGLVNSLREALSLFGGQVSFPEVTEVDTEAVATLARVKPSAKEKAARKAS